MWVDIPPFSPSTLPLANETQTIFALCVSLAALRSPNANVFVFDTFSSSSSVNATARLGTACAAYYPGSEGRVTHC